MSEENLGIDKIETALKDGSFNFEDVLNEAFQIFSEKIDSGEYIIGYEGNAFSSTGDIKNDLLSIAAVHPMRKDAVSEFLMRAGVDWSIVQQLIAQDKLRETEFKGRKFYIRNLKQ